MNARTRKKLVARLDKADTDIQEAHHLLEKLAHAVRPAGRNNRVDRAIAGLERAQEAIGSAQAALEDEGDG